MDKRWIIHGFRNKSTNESLTEPISRRSEAAHPSGHGVNVSATDGSADGDTVCLNVPSPIKSHNAPMNQWILFGGGGAHQRGGGSDCKFVGCVELHSSRRRRPMTGFLIKVTPFDSSQQTSGERGQSNLHICIVWCLSTVNSPSVRVVVEQTSPIKRRLFDKWMERWQSGKETHSVVKLMDESVASFHPLQLANIKLCGFVIRWRPHSDREFTFLNETANLRSFALVRYFTN